MDFKTINELSTEVHKNAVAKGFWENNPSDEHFLCLVISELMEAVEADRKGRHAQVENFNQSMSEYMDVCDNLGYKCAFKRYFEKYIKDTISDEISDAFIRLLDLAGAREYEFNTDLRIIDLVQENNSFTENIYIIIQAMVNSGNTLCIAMNMPPNYQIDIVMHEIIELSRILKIDLEYHVRLKMRYNALREYKHGKAY